MQTNRSTQVIKEKSQINQNFTKSFHNQKPILIQNEEFKKQTSKPFLKKAKESFNQSQDVSVAETQINEKLDIELSDIESLKSSLIRIKESQSRQQIDLQEYLNETQKKYDFPSNYDEIINNSVNQVRYKKQRDSDLVSVYSSIQGIEFEFEEKKKNEQKRLQRNLQQIKELEKILAEKEQQYQSLMSSRIESQHQSIISDNKSQASEASNNMFLTHIKPEKKNREERRSEQIIKKNESQQDKHSKSTQKQAIFGPNFMEINKIIQKREDKFKLTEEEQARVEEIINQKQQNIYKDYQIDQKIDDQLQMYAQDLVKILNTEEKNQKNQLQKQPKDTFILKQKVEQDLIKQSQKLNEQLHQFALMSDKQVSQDEIKQCINLIRQSNTIQLPIEQNENIKDILDHLKNLQKQTEIILPELEALCKNIKPLPPIPQFTEVNFDEIVYPESILDKIKKLYSENKNFLKNQQLEIEDFIQKDHEKLLQFDQTNFDAFEQQQIFFFIEEQQLQQEDIEDIQKKIEEKAELEFKIPEELLNFKEGELLFEEPKQISKQAEELFEYQYDTAVKELEMLGVDFQQELQIIRQSGQLSNILQQLDQSNQTNKHQDKIQSNISSDLNIYQEQEEKSNEFEDSLENL